MTKEITFHINNMAYTINIDESMQKDIGKYLDLNKNNDTKDLLAAYIRVIQEYTVFKNDVEKISTKLVKF